MVKHFWCFTFQKHVQIRILIHHGNLANHFSNNSFTSSWKNPISFDRWNSIIYTFFISHLFEENNSCLHIHIHFFSTIDLITKTKSTLIFQNYFTKQNTGITVLYLFKNRFHGFHYYLHLFIPTFELSANQGSMINIQRNVTALLRPSYNAGLSCKRKPRRNQWIICLSLCTVFDGVIVTLSLWNFDDPALNCSVIVTLPAIILLSICKLYEQLYSFSFESLTWWLQYFKWSQNYFVKFI